MRYKTLQEKAKALGKQLLIEHFELVVKSDNIEMFEKPKIIESTSGHSFKARGVIKDADITKYTENLNGRIYTKELWENVNKSGLAEGSLSLADHPEGEGSVKDITGVWHNFKVLEDTSQADLYLVGSNGDLLKEAAEAGAKIGFSTVGFGEFLEDEKTVNPSSYELERLGDWVINPSQQLFNTVDKFMSSDQAAEEIEKQSEPQKLHQSTEKKITNNSKDNEIIDKKENSEDNVMDKLQEATFKNQIRVAIKEAKKNPNPNEAIQDLQAIVIPEELSELKNKIQETVEHLQDVMDNKINSTEKELSELKEVKEKFETLEKEHKELKEKFDKLVTISEKIGVIEDDEGEYKYVNEEEVKTLHENVRNMKLDLVAYKEDTSLRDYDIKCLLEDRKMMEEDIEKFEKFLKEAEERIVAYEEELEKLGFEFEEGKGKKKEQDDDDDDEKEEQEDDDEDEKEESKKKKEQDDDDEDEKEEKVKKKESKKKKEQDDDDDDEKEEQEDDDEDEKEEKKKEAAQVIKDYIKDQIEKYPALKSIERDLYESETIVEAVEKIEAFQGDDDERPVKLKESTSFSTDDDWLGKRL